MLTFVGPDLVAARWKQFRAYFADVAPGRSGWGGATLMGGVGASAAPMNGYPKVFNIESDPREEHNIGEMYNWVIGPVLKVVEEYKASLPRHPNPPPANMTRFLKQRARDQISGEQTHRSVNMRPINSTMGLNRRFLLSALAALPVLGASLRSTPALAQGRTDWLPSWNDGPTKASITDFVARVTSGPDFVPEDQRIATFDNDGTLWVEQPMYVQLAFILDRVKALAPQNPSWKTKQPFKAVLDGDMRALAASGEKGLVEIMAATHAGMTTAEFEKIVSEWLATARDHRFKRPYTELVYQPMLELLAYLRANGFKTFIVSGGGIEFMRPWTEKVYGVRPSRWSAPRSRHGSRCVTASRCCSGCRRSTSSTTRPANRSASTSTSVGARSRRSAIRTATWKCCNGRRWAQAARGSG